MNPITEEFLNCLPPSLSRPLRRAILAVPGADACLTGITLRKERVSSLSLDGRHIPLPFVLSGDAMEEAFRALCGGAVYPHEESLAAGYFTLPSGVRVGVAGRAAHRGRATSGIFDINTLCLRLFSDIRGAGSHAEHVFRGLTAQGGLLIYSPPAVGKTTLLCDLARRLSSGEAPLAVAVVDERMEMLARFPEKNLLLSFLSGFPKEEGIEIATRTLSPDVILCDEIGNEREAAVILSLANAGVPLIASAHAGSLRALLSRPPLARLWEAGVFGAAIGISRHSDGSRSYETTYREAEA